MSKIRALGLLLLLTAAFSAVSFAVVPDRINGIISRAAVVPVKGNTHGLAKAESDLGRVDGARLMQGVSLAFHPSAAQQQQLDQFISELGNPSSPNYHKYLTPAQFADRYGMSRGDIAKITAWLQSEGFTNINVANSRNEVSFDGTVAQVESVFAVEMHHYLVDGVVHMANAGDPSVPAALGGSVLHVGHLNSFAPKPRIKARPELTSFVSGNHFLTPADFATIYDLNALYSAGATGSNQKIAIVGQSTVSTTDLNNFRTAAGLPASTVTMTLAGGTAAKCTGDEGESDLDIEWAGGVAKSASIIFVYAGLGTGDTCGGNRNITIWDALNYAIQNKTAPFISSSYGYCESGLGNTFLTTLQNWANQAITQGQTIVSASGDAGAADCENAGSTSATTGFAVDAPASVPGVTGAGGTTFSGDAAGAVSGTAPNTTAAADAPYWAASGTGSDTVASALEYIPEVAWNDTAFDISQGGGLSASGGGKSTFFAKPSWQTGTGVPNDGQRDVPDIAVSTSADHDGYLVCSEDGANGQCTSGFRNGTGGSFSVVGGTSAAAPTFSAILALVNQYIGNAAPTGIAPVNQTLYSLASNASSRAAFHDITSGNNMVPCTSGTTNCPSGTTQFGFSAGPGYDQVTGLGSVDGYALAQAWSGAPGFKLNTAAPTYQVTQGSSVTAQVNLTALNGFTGSITYTCNDAVAQSTCTGPSGAVSSSMPASFVVTTTAPTARLDLPFNRGMKIFYASLVPGLMGIVFVAAPKKRSIRGMQLLGLIAVLGFSTLGLGSCGGSNSPKNTNPGTPAGTYTITVTGTSGSLSRQTSFQLVVVP